MWDSLQSSPSTWGFRSRWLPSILNVFQPLTHDGQPMNEPRPEWLRIARSPHIPGRRRSSKRQPRRYVLRPCRARVEPLPLPLRPLEPKRGQFSISRDGDRALPCVRPSVGVPPPTQLVSSPNSSKMR